MNNKTAGLLILLLGIILLIIGIVMMILKSNLSFIIVLFSVIINVAGISLLSYKKEN